MTEQVTQDEPRADDAMTQMHDDPPETLPSEQLPDEDQTQGPKLVPVSESKRYRRRAQAAEQRVRELESDIAQRQEQLAQREQQLDEIARRQAIDTALREQDAIDVEVARLLVQQTLDEQDEGDVDTVVRDLRRRKPFMFRARRSTAAATTLGPRPGDGNRQGEGRMEHAAEQAIRTGRRGDLLRYLSLRRSHR